MLMEMAMSENKFDSAGAATNPAHPVWAIVKGSGVRYLSSLCCLCLALALPLGTAAAEDAPRFDAAQSCRRGETIQLGVNPFGACMKQEDEARDELKAQWSQFSQTDTAACIRLSKSGGVAGSYVELLTCLEMKKFPKHSSSFQNENTTVYSLATGGHFALL